jgi:protein-L-isoaspartate(D-aspartate) O-methyltransferase
MWRNTVVRDFVDWLCAHNAALTMPERVRFAGLDLYSLYTSLDAVISYLEHVDADAAALARERYGCLTPWQSDPAAYGKAALSGAYRTCETEVVHMLKDLLSKRLAYAPQSREQYFDAVQNAQLIADAERYYRIMYYGSHESWNLRDRHMFDTLQRLMEFRGTRSRAVIWAHNSHIGDASATEMSARGELNIGQLCREHWGDEAYAIGFGTDSGTVAAASYWDGPMEIKHVQPSHEESYEFLCHEAGIDRFALPLRREQPEALHRALMTARLERAIGVIYRPETELASHYFHAVLPRQFDELIWLDRTSAVEPLETIELKGLPDTYPFGL